MIMPPVIAHRGASATAPENTIAAFRKAAEAGARWVELDVQLTADRVPVVFHDMRLGRTSSGRGAVCRRTAAEIGRLDAGGWFATAYAGEPVPTLRQALTALAALGLGVNIEIKPTRGQEADTARRAIAVAEEVWPDDAPPLLLSSFSRIGLAAARDARPDWRRGLLAGALPRDWRAAVAELDCATVHLDHRHLAQRHIEPVRERGIGLLVYTVNDPARARELWDYGVTSVITDRPAELLAVF